MKRKSIGNNLSYMGVANIISYAFLYITTIYIARTFLPSDFGRINFAQAVGIYIGLLNDGLKTLGVRNISKAQPDKRRAVYDNWPNLVTASILLLAIGSAVTLAVSIDPDFKILIISYILSSMIMACFFTDWIFQGYESMSVIGIANALRYLVYLVTVFLLLSIRKSIIMVGLAMLTSSLIACLFLLYRLAKDGIGIRLSFQIRHLFSSHHLTDSLALGFISLRNQLLYFSTTLLLGLLSFNYEAGIFNAAFKLAFFIGSFGNLYMMAIFPRICDYCAQGKPLLERFLNRSNELLLFMLIPIGVGGAWLSRKIVVAIYGHTYLKSQTSLIVLLWSVAIMLLGYGLSSALIGYQAHAAVLKIVVFGVLFNLLLCAVIITLFDALWISVAALLSEIITFAWLKRAVHQISGIDVIYPFVKPAVASGMMLAALLLVARWDLIHSIVVGGLAYAFSVYLLGGRKNFAVLVKELR